MEEGRGPGGEARSGADPLPPYRRRAAPPPRGARGRPSLRTAAAALPSSRRGQWGKSPSLLPSFLPSLPLSATASAPRAARPLRSAGPRRARGGAERSGAEVPLPQRSAARSGAAGPRRGAEPLAVCGRGGEGTAVRCRCAAASERWGRRAEVMAGGACAAQVGAHPRTCPLRAAACGCPYDGGVPRRAAVRSALLPDAAMPELSVCAPREDAACCCGYPRRAGSASGGAALQRADGQTSQREQRGDAASASQNPDMWRLMHLNRQKRRIFRARPKAC